MGIQNLILAISLALFACQSTAVPHDVVNPRATRESSILQAEKLQARYPGLYFYEAAENCNNHDFDTLVKTVEEIEPYMKKNKNNTYHTPGWNRFFVHNELIPNSFHTQKGDIALRKRDWEYPAIYPFYKMIINNFNQVINFPTKGKKNAKEGKQKDRITLTCKHINIKAEDMCQTSDAVWAATYRPWVTGRGEVVVFCRNFFNDRKTKHLSELTKVHRYEHQLSDLVSREHVMAHEFFHCGSAVGTEEFITDKWAELPGEGIFTKVVKVYGARKCEKYAWLYLQPEAKRTQVNIMVRANADNYAWLFTFNWFNDAFKWKSNGDYLWSSKDLKRSLVGANGTNSTSWEDMNWEGTATFNDDSLADADEAWPLPNCRQADNDPMNVTCEYMDEPYKQGMKAIENPTIDSGPDCAPQDKNHTTIERHYLIGAVLGYCNRNLTRTQGEHKGLYISNNKNGSPKFSIGFDFSEEQGGCKAAQTYKPTFDDCRGKFTSIVDDCNTNSLDKTGGTRVWSTDQGCIEYSIEVYSGK